MTVQSDVDTKEPQDFDEAFDEFSQGDNSENENDETLEVASPQSDAAGEVAEEILSEPEDTTSQEDLKTLIEGLRSEVTQLKQGQQTQEKADENQPDDSSTQDESGLMQGEGWESLKEDLPEVANVIEAQKQQINHLSEQVKVVTAQSVEQYQAQQIGIMDKAIPEWRNVIGNDEFVSWVQKQPNQVQQIIDSPQASEVSWLIGLYKEQSASDIKEKRQQAAQSAVEVPTKNSGARPSGSVPDDFDAAFDYYSKQS